MVCHQYLDAMGLRGGNAGVGSNAVIDRQNQVGTLLYGNVHQLRRQAIAKIKAVGHQIIDLLQPHHAQGTNGHGSAGCAIGVKIPHHKHPLLLLHRIYQQHQRGIQPFHGVIRQQRFQRQLQFVVTGHTTSCINTLQGGRNTTELPFGR